MSIGNKTVRVSLILLAMCLVAISPILGLSIPRSSATASSRLFYPDLNTSSGCGYGLDNTIPGFALGNYFTPTFTMTFCGTANQTWSLLNGTFTMLFDIFSTQHLTVTVALSDNGIVIAQSSSTPTTINRCCCQTPFTYSLSPSNGGLMKTGDTMVLNVTVTGNTNYVGPCTGTPYLSTLTIYGAPQVAGPVTLSQQQCKSLLNLPYGQLNAGSKVTEMYAPSKTFTVPNVANWYWFFVPSNGQNPNATATQVVTQLWSSGHGQNFDFFIGTYNGQTGVILMTDYSLVYECSSGS